MKHSKGFAIPLLILSMAIVISLAVYVYLQNKLPSDEGGLTKPVACTEEAMQCPDGSYVGRTGPNCEFVCPVATDTPKINSITPASGPIGTIVEIKGINLNGFEGDMDAIIENSKGETAVLLGMTRNEPNLIRVKIENKICRISNSYSGLPCKSYLNISPGVYNIYTSPWGKNSNKVQFTVTSGELMSLNIYVQDKEAVKINDCRIT